MYDLHLSSEQLEMRDTVRDFVEREIKPIALNPDRLQPFEKPLLLDLLDQASQLGLRAIALSEEAGGAGADRLTTCIILEELAAGDPDIAVVLAHTSALARTLFEQMMTPAQHSHFLPLFQQDDRYHLAFAGQDQSADIGWCYHRPLTADASNPLNAAKQSNGDWIINGSVPGVANAPIAKLFAIQVSTDPNTTGFNGLSTLLVPRDTPGFTVGEPPRAVGESGVNGEPVNSWYHGTVAGLQFEDCRVSAEALLGEQGQNPIADIANKICGAAELAAINLGIGRAAYETALDYTKMRRQGGRNIVEHQAIGSILADCALKLELARSSIWKAAWFADHPDATAQHNPSEIPLQDVARIYTAEVVHDITLSASECFGAMGVMRDMPLQKYIQDGLVFLHAESNDSAKQLRIAEAVAGYRRPLNA